LFLGEETAVGLKPDTAPSKSLTLPHGRATEHADAQVSSPRVSKGCASRNDLQDFDGPVKPEMRLKSLPKTTDGLTNKYGFQPCWL